LGERFNWQHVHLTNASVFGRSRFEPIARAGGDICSAFREHNVQLCDCQDFQPLSKYVQQRAGSGPAGGIRPSLFRPSGFSPTKAITLDVANNQALNVAGRPDAAARQDSQDIPLSRPASPPIDQHSTIFSSSNFQPRTSNLFTSSLPYLLTSLLPYFLTPLPPPLLTSSLPHFPLFSFLIPGFQLLVSIFARHLSVVRQNTSWSRGKRAWRLPRPPRSYRGLLSGRPGGFYRAIPVICTGTPRALPRGEP